MADAASRLSALTQELIGAPPPVRIRAWDGSTAGPAEGPTVVIRSRRALRRIMWKPGELGLARAYVSGDLDVEGDLYEVLDRLASFIWERTDAEPHKLSALDPKVRSAAKQFLQLAGPFPPPPPPVEEIRGRAGTIHTKRRDKQAISHHYDVGNDFYGMVLGPSMVYSCAYWDDAPGFTLEDAQRDKLDLVCRKLDLKEGDRLLDVGCGWGSMALHAAREYGAHVTGVTLSREQAAYARKRVADAGLTDRVEIRVQDYRDVKDGPYDAISSIGMAEHVGSVQFREYADVLYALLKPGGRLLNHQIARRPLAHDEAYEIDAFIDRYVFPDGELAPVGRTLATLEEAGFEARDVHSIREHYALTLRRWVANLEENWRDAVRATSPGRARVWRLYMAASALSFERNKIGVNQILAVRTPESGASGTPRRALDWR
ncbi:cyclopropane-fatty-acyl-phospholipid synthase family protein [Streptomyces sp. NBC_01497]|uniref:cyclopropane-fatty-acyl-phospholipid synthase family protein n=1 Tax=Streptomyces sp. NBC_01497 TaxID=2903885 RepID=UPI002E33C8BA|nr:cyclopropane-fatty-acyl-phospholipid synthase family protein [Streptomyces sp. NBC_01497]